MIKPFNLEEYLKNPSQELITRDGRKVKRISFTREGGIFPIVASVESFDRETNVTRTYTRDGKFFADNSINENDLFFAPENHGGWLNIFKRSDGIAFLDQSRIFKSKEDAESGGMKRDGYLLTIKIEWEE